MKRTALLIDGGHLRVLAKQAGHDFNPDFIERFSRECSDESEELLRVLYYDCAPFNGTVKLPVSGERRTIRNSDQWLKDLAARDLFAVRLGVLKFRGFSLRGTAAPGTLTDDDFKANYEQKGVDMRIGLDIATFASARSVDRIVLVSGDTDCVPAMKHARIAGLQIVLITVPGQRTAAELTWHADIQRAVKWPA